MDGKQDSLEDTDSIWHRGDLDHYTLRAEGMRKWLQMKNPDEVIAQQEFGYQSLTAAGSEQV